MADGAPHRAGPGGGGPAVPASCDGCGVCCEEAGMPPGYVRPDLMDFLPEALRDELAVHLAEEAAAGFTRNQRGLPCIWYDPGTHGCRHYALRPDACRDAPVGGDSCLFWRARRFPRP